MIPFRIVLLVQQLVLLLWIQIQYRLSLSLSWLSTGAGAYNLEWGPCGFTQGTGSTAVATTNNYTITGLAASQCVDVYIIPDCSSTGNGTGTMTGPFSFYSSQPVISSFPFLANFNSNDGGFLASGTNASWEWGTPTGTTISSASSSPNAWVTDLAGSYNSNEFSYLTSPVFDFSSVTADVVLYFNLFYQTESCCDETWIEISMDGGITWNKILGNGTESNWYNDASNNWWDGTNSGWNQSSINFNTLSGQSAVQFRFVFSSDGSVTADGVGIDDFGLAILTCGVPTGLSYTALSSDSLVISWTSTATNFNIEYGPTGFTPGAGTFLYNVTNPDTISGLVGGTTYQVYIQDSCGIGNSGIWAGPLNATTLQNTVSTFPYSANFETSQDGWISYGNSNSWQWGTPSGTVISSAPQGSKAWVTNLAGNYNNNELSYLQSPIFDCSAEINDLEYSFNMIYETESCCDEGWVEYSFDGINWTKLIDNGSAQNWYNDVNNQWWDGGNGTAWTNRFNVIPGSAGQSFVQIRHIVSTDGSIVREGFGIDEISIVVPQCALPYSLGAANISTYTADLFWTTSGTSTIVEWGPTGFVPGTGTGTITVATNDTVSLSGLLANTCYDFYVQDSCTSGGSIVGPFNFCTLPTCPAATNLDTNSVTSTSAWLTWTGNNATGNYQVSYGSGTFQPAFGTLVSATSMSTQLTTLNPASQYCFYVREICTVGDTSAWAGPFCFTTACSANLPGDDVASAIVANSFPYNYAGQTALCYTNQISLRGSNDVVFAYVPTQSASSATISLCGSSFDTYLYILDKQLNTVASNDDNCGLSSSVTLSSSPYIISDTLYVVVEAYSASGGGAFNLDITEVTPCPSPTALTMGTQYCTSVEVSWTASAVDYELEYGSTGFTHGSGMIATSTATTKVITGLAPNTSYDVYVRGNCGSGDTSAWTGPLAISTLTSTASISASHTVGTVTLTDRNVDFSAAGSVADSISWSFGDGSAIEYGNTVSHLYTVNGSYTVTATAIAECVTEDTSFVVLIEEISILEGQPHIFNVFPNPTTGTITVQFDEVTGQNAVLELVDLQGRVLSRENAEFNTVGSSVQMNLSDLPKGMYVLRFNGENTIQVERIVLK